MYIIIWEFTVRPERVPDFISAYRSEGAWAQLFRRAPGYHGTELLASADRPGQFITIDRWDNAACFEEFQQNFGSEYKQLDSRLEEITLSETRLGIFSAAVQADA